MCRDFAARELTPNARKWDENHEWPERGRQEAGRAGAAGHRRARGVGRRGPGQRQLRAGHGGDQPRLRLHRRHHERQQLALLRPGGASSAPTSRRSKFLTPFARGEKLGCFGLTEPQAGSDAAAQQDGGGARRAIDYVINGSKNWITNGPQGRRHRALRDDRQGRRATRASPPSWCRPTPRASRAARPTRRWASPRPRELHHVLRGLRGARGATAWARRARASRSP